MIDISKNERVRKTTWWSTREEKLVVVEMWEDITGYAFMGDIDDSDHFDIIHEYVMKVVEE